MMTALNASDNGHDDQHQYIPATLTNGEMIWPASQITNTFNIAGQ